LGGGFPQTAQDTKSGAGQYFTPPAEIAREIIEDLEAALEQFRLIDAPLGWPAAYAAALIDHFAGAALNGPKNALFRRRTDESVQRRIGKTPLEVGADRIARASFSALEALELLRQFAQRPIPLAWAADSLEGIATIEVYPAATLKVRGIVEPGYKKPCNTEARSRASCTWSMRTAFRWIEADRTGDPRRESTPDSLATAA